MDMDAYNEDFKVDTGSKRKSYEIEYESLSQAAVETSMRHDIDHICGILGADVGGNLHMAGISDFGDGVGRHSCIIAPPLVVE